MDRLQTSWAQNYVESSNSHDDTAFGAIWSGHLRDPWWELFFVDVSSNTLLFFCQIQEAAHVYNIASLRSRCSGPRA
jgi:hypothetical protein